MQKFAISLLIQTDTGYFIQFQGACEGFAASYRMLDKEDHELNMKDLINFINLKMDYPLGNNQILIILITS